MRGNFVQKYFLLYNILINFGSELPYPSTKGASEISLWQSHRNRSPTKLPRRRCGANSSMSTTHLSYHYHIVFSTKERRELIADEWRGRLFAFMGGCIKTSGGFPEAIGGTRNHIHILFGLGSTRLVADIVKEIKVASSRWIRTEMGAKAFSWQRGYGGFTVSPSQIELVKKYVLNQEEHHRRKTFEEEYVALLKLAVVEYDERFLW